ncbi:MAG: hypothetical protein ABIP65_08135 [Vicinamibacterales bacterium]
MAVAHRSRERRDPDPQRCGLGAIPASGQGNRVAISIEAGTGPVWSRGGRELFYRAGDDLLSVQVRTDSGLVLGERPTRLDIITNCFDELNRLVPKR